jgi:hypothetical protein
MLSAFYLKYQNILRLNRNMIISGIAGFIASAVTAELYSSYTENDLLSSLATVLTGIAISKVRGLTWTRKEILSKFVAQGILMLLVYKIMISIIPTTIPKQMFLLLLGVSHLIRPLLFFAWQIGHRA